MKKILIALFAMFIALGVVVGVSSPAKATIIYTIDTDQLDCFYYGHSPHPNITGTVILQQIDGYYYVKLNLIDDGVSGDPAPHDWWVHFYWEGDNGSGGSYEFFPSGEYHKQVGPYGPHKSYIVDIQDINTFNNIGCSGVVFLHP